MENSENSGIETKETDIPAASPQDAGLSGEELRLSFDGRLGDMIRLSLKNFLLNLLTLFFYRFWGRTNVRKYLWGHTRLNDEAFEYTGRGIHMLIGFMVVFIGFIVVSFVIQFLEGFLVGHRLGWMAVELQIAYFAALLFFIGFAIYSTMNYRLTHTNWRGIRGSLTGSRKSYGYAMLGNSVLVGLTFGLTYPVYRFRLFARMMRETAFGDRVFSCIARPGKLYPAFIPFLILGLLYFGATITAAVFTLQRELDAFFFHAVEEQAQQTQNILAWIMAATDEPRIILSGWQSAVIFLPIILLTAVGTALLAFYRSREFKWFAAQTRLEGLSFAFNVGTWPLFRLAFGNMLITIFSLGILQPVTQYRTFRFFCRHLKVAGRIDLDNIRQASRKKADRGEGLAELFDMGTV